MKTQLKLYVNNSPELSAPKRGHLHLVKNEPELETQKYVCEMTK